MSKTAHMLFAIETDLPFRKSSGVINHYFLEGIETLGFKVHRFHRDSRLQLPHAEQLIPFSDASLLHKVVMAPTPAVTFYDDLGLSIRPPVARHGHRNFLFFHGLRGNPSIVSGSNAIDLFCTNSRYLERTLSSIFLLPDWSRGCVLQGRGAAALTSVRLPIPLLDYPDGYPSVGDDLPQEVLAALDNGVILGHSLQRKKALPEALVAILCELNSLAAERKYPLYRVVVTHEIMPEVNALISMLPEFKQKRVAKYFLPVQQLNNTALVSLMRACRFGLSFNRIPDSFGLYPLESVFLGCPIYTNGIGNNRWLLPQDSGITVMETESMAFGSVRDYLTVARRIQADLVAGQEDACARGRCFISKEHNRATFNEDLATAVKSLDDLAGEISFEELQVGYSPTVRSFNPQSGRVVSDHRNLELDQELVRLIQEVIGSSATWVRRHCSTRFTELTYLFHHGVLCLQRDASTCPTLPC